MARSSSTTRMSGERSSMVHREREGETGASEGGTMDGDVTTMRLYQRLADRQSNARGVAGRTMTEGLEHRLALERQDTVAAVGDSDLHEVTTRAGGHIDT